MKTSAEEIAQTETIKEAFQAIYTDSEMMLMWLQEAETLAGKTRRAQHCLRVALDPRSRYGLEKADTAAVVPVCEAFLAECSKRAEPLREALRAARSTGLQWDESWNVCSELADTLGFSRGDSRALGF